MIFFLHNIEIPESFLTGVLALISTLVGGFLSSLLLNQNNGNS
jgi:hypothetical protein